MVSLTVPPIQYTLIEAVTTLRYMRKVRDELRQNIRELQERMRLGHDGYHNSAALALDAELCIVEESVRKLWEAYTATAPPPHEPL